MVLVSGCDSVDAARLQAIAEEVLGALGADFDLPLHVADRPASGFDGWANPRGVFIVRDQLDELSDEELRWLVAEECAHHWLGIEFPELLDPVRHEAFAVFFTARHCGVVWEPGELSSSYSFPPRGPGRRRRQRRAPRRRAGRRRRRPGRSGRARPRARGDPGPRAFASVLARRSAV